MNTDHDKDQIEAQFTKLEEAIAASNPGILDVLQVYGGYEEAIQQAEAYLAAFEAQPLCCQQPRDSEAHKDRIAFVGLLPTLLREHEGEVALMEGGELVGIFASDEAAFAEGVERFGIKRPFTMRPIVPESARD